jgi:uncharacterized protein YacL
VRVRQRSARAPVGVIELLRLFVVVFFAGVGYQVARSFDNGTDVLGPLNGVAVGVIIGSGLGYVVGGVLGRSTVLAADQSQAALRDTSAESLVAGAIGVVIGVLVGAGVAWPVFLIPQPLLAVPLFGFIVAVLGYLGFGIGSAKRHDLLRLFGASAGMAPTMTPTAALPRVLDTSVAIDGRVVEVVRAGFLHGTMLVPSPVLAELQGLADAADDLRRSRGRRGLAVLESLRREPGVDVQVIDNDVPGVPDVDAKLVRLCLDSGAALLTLDTNLARSAALAGVRVLNLHALGLSMRPPVSAGDEISVLLLKPGTEAGQAVGYLDDGTMVIAERSRAGIGREHRVRVTSVLTTANGRLVFSRPVVEPPVPSPAPEARPTPADVAHQHRSR